MNFFIIKGNRDIKEPMVSRLKRRAERQQKKERITFLDSENYIPRTKIKVRDAIEGRFEGAAVLADLQRQWIQGQSLIKASRICRWKIHGLQLANTNDPTGVRFSILLYRFKE